MIALLRSKKKVVLSEEERRKSLLVSLLCGGCVMLPALCYAVLGDAPLISGLLIGPVILACLIRNGLPITGRTVIYTVVIAGTVTVILNQVYKVDPDRFFMPLPAELAVPFFLGIAAGFCFMIQNTQSITLIVMMSVMAMLEMGTSLNDPTDNQRLVVRGTIWAQRHVTYGVTVVLQMGTILPLLHVAAPRRRSADTQTATGWRRPLTRVISVLALIGVSLLFCWLLPGWFERMDNVMTPMLNSYFRFVRTPRVFGEDVDLNHTLGLKNEANSHKIVFRAEAEHAPMYMRGRVYVHYAEGRWQARTDLASLPTLDVDETLSVKRFDRTREVDERNALPDTLIHVYMTDRYRTDILFAPGNTTVVETIAERLSMGPDGDMTPQGWDEQGGYTLFVPRLDSYAVWPRPTPETQAADDPYLAVPEALRDSLDLHAARILGAAEQPDARQIGNVQLWFNNEYDYELGAPLVRGKDPVLSFLEDLESGHCELFATASALLLRSRGIPTRYVTGFVCAEEHPQSGYWLARLGDSHAWVEAYDRQLQRWVLVESTPASGIPQGPERSSWLESLRERLAARWEVVFVRIKRGYFAEAIMGVLGAIWSTVAWAFWAGPWYLMWPLILVVAWWLWGDRWRRWLAGRQQDQAESEVLAELRLWRQRLEKRLRSRGVQPGPQKSVRDLMRELRARNDADQTASIALLEEYEALRYQPDHPSLSAVSAFGKRVEAWLRGTTNGTGSAT